MQSQETLSARGTEIARDERLELIASELKSIAKVLCEIRDRIDTDKVIEEYQKEIDAEDQSLE